MTSEELAHLLATPGVAARLAARPHFLAWDEPPQRKPGEQPKADERPKKAEEK